MARTPEPNAKTRAAIEAAVRGETVRVENVDELLADVERDHEELLARLEAMAESYERVAEISDGMQEDFLAQAQTMRDAIAAIRGG